MTSWNKLARYSFSPLTEDQLAFEKHVVILTLLRSVEDATVYMLLVDKGSTFVVDLLGPFDVEQASREWGRLCQVPLPLERMF